MFSNYIKIAWRLIQRNRLYSAINILGLAIGMAACLLLLIFVFHELRFDNFHENSDRLYRLVSERHSKYGDEVALPTPAPLGPQINAHFPEVEMFSRLQTTSVLIRYGDNEVDALHAVAFVDSTFLNMFSFDIVSGDRRTALSQPHAIVLTERTAERLFGDENPIGQEITLQNRSRVTVTAVIENSPSNSHLYYRALVPFPTLAEVRNSDDLLTNEHNWNYSTYMMLKPGSSPQSLEEKMPAFLDENVEEGMSKEYTMILQPLEDVHLTTGISFETASVIDSRYLYGLSVLAIFILTIACVNFMNLATARSLQRAKEVGLRKVMGADRKRLIKQFLGESILLSLIAVPVAIAIVEFFLPTFSQLVGRRLELVSHPTMPVLFLIPLLAVLVGLGGGAYPAFFLSVFEPASILRGSYATGRRGVGFRKGLIVFQFVLSVILLIATLVVHRQVDYMVSRDPGYDREQIAYTGYNERIQQKYDVFRNEILALPGVKAVARGASVPCQVGTRQGYMAGVDDGEDTLMMYSLIADYDYIDAVGLELKAGRNFDRTFATDENRAYIINETAASTLSWGDSAVGRDLRVWSEEPGTVVGVVKDFNFKSLRREIEPLVLRMEPGWLGTVVIRLAADDIDQTIAAIEEEWEQLAPDYPFGVTYLDQAFMWQYRSEQRLEKIFVYATILAIIVACLGLYGIAHYATVVRTREVGVRKVLGASVRSVTMLFIREFSLYVVIANVIAWPVAYLAMRSWLNDFAYRISIGVDILLASAAVVLLVALATVAFRAYRTANTNPARALRYE